jgi:transcriptional regulator
MYAPSHFREERVPILQRAITDIAFGTLIAAGKEGLEAHHLPLMLSPEPGPYGILTGHVARANPVWKNVGSGVQALAMFLGPQAYVSPSWYPTKKQTGKVVPTWNYVSVHAHGELEFFDDRPRLQKLVEHLTDKHERGRAAPWTVGDAPPDYVAKLLEAIVGFTLRITRLEGSWKLSQNRTQEDRAGVRQGLADDGSPEQAAVMKLMEKL